MSDVDFLELSQEEEMELVTQVKKLEDTNNLYLETTSVLIHAINILTIIKGFHNTKCIIISTIVLY
jgi:hypothetical protein